MQNLTKIFLMRRCTVAFKVNGAQARVCFKGLDSHYTLHWFGYKIKQVFESSGMTILILRHDVLFRNLIMNLILLSSISYASWMWGEILHLVFIYLVSKFIYKHLRLFHGGRDHVSFSKKCYGIRFMCITQQQNQFVSLWLIRDLLGHAMQYVSF